MYSGDTASPAGTHSPACGAAHLRQVVEVAKQRGKRMDPRHRRFVLEYIQDLDATAAARRAGYSPRSAKNTGYRLMQRPEIQQAIAEAQADLERELIDSAERVRRDLLRATEGAIEDRDWRGIGKILELRCKVHQMLTERIEHTGPGGGPIRMAHDTARQIVEDSGAADLAHSLFERVAQHAGQLGLDAVRPEVVPGAAPAPPQSPAY
jgi:phage terminase small subunit